LTIAAEDFEDANFELATASQLNSMNGVEQERFFDGGKLGALIEPNSLFVCGASCKLINSQSMCVGNKCISLAGSKQRNAALMVGVDTLGRRNIEIDFQVYTKSPVTSGYTVCVDYAVSNNGEWEQLQCYDRTDIRSKEWTALQATLTFRGNVPIVQFRVRSLQRQKSLLVDDIKILGLSPEGPDGLPGQASEIPETRLGKFFSRDREGILAQGYVPKYPRLENLSY
jgi:hypothetical protein